MRKSIGNLYRLLRDTIVSEQARCAKVAEEIGTTHRNVMRLEDECNGRSYAHAHEEGAMTAAGNIAAAIRNLSIAS